MFFILFYISEGESEPMQKTYLMGIFSNSVSVEYREMRKNINNEPYAA